MSKPRMARRQHHKPAPSTRTPSRELATLTNRLRELLKGSRLSTETVLDAYETSLVDAGLGD